MYQFQHIGSTGPKFKAKRCKKRELEKSIRRDDEKENSKGDPLAPVGGIWVGLFLLAAHLALVVFILWLL